MSAQNFEQQVIFYHNIFVCCAIAAVIFLMIAIALFFLLKIPRVFGEMTGRDARKAIDEMMEENAMSGSLTSSRLEDGRKKRKGRSGSLATGRLKKNTRSYSTGNLNQNADMESVFAGQMNQSLANNQMIQRMETMSQPDNFGNEATDVLDTYGEAPTDVLDTYGSAPTAVLTNCESASMDAQEHFNEFKTEPVYQQPVSETMVLDQGMFNGTNSFVILRSIVEIHTDEVI